MGYKMATFNKKKTNMNVDILKGEWKEIKGEVKQKWGHLIGTLGIAQDK